MRTLILVLFLVGCHGGSQSSDDSDSGGPAANPPPQAGSFPNDNSALGTNLSEVSYYSTELVFKDLFKQASDWIPQQVAGGPWNTGQSFAGYTSDGYPLLNAGQAAMALLCWDMQGHYPGGSYVCLYEGTGSIEFQFGATVTSSSPGQYNLNVNSSNGGIGVKIVASNSADPVRNIRMVATADLATYQAEPFRPEFLSRWERFKVIRFMNWQRTNGTLAVNFSDLATATTYSQGTGRGVAPEYMVRYCNRINADAWICIPHQASDGFVTQFATYFRDNLNPGLRVYIEYSNEIWNGIFPQAAYCQQQGLALGLSSNGFEAQLRYQSRRSVEIFQIFASVFGGTSRLVRTLASQAANAWTGTTILDWQNAYQSADALAIAPYIGGYLGSSATQNTVSQYTIPQLLAAVQDDIANASSWTSQNASAAASRGLELVAYEGGQHLVGTNGAQDNQALTDLFVSANRDAGMGTVLGNYLAAWRNAGGRMFVQYSSIYPGNKWGSWGALEFNDETTSPKYEALLQFIQSNPRWW